MALFRIFNYINQSNFNSLDSDYQGRRWPYRLTMLKTKEAAFERQPHGFYWIDWYYPHLDVPQSGQIKQPSW